VLKIAYVPIVMADWDGISMAISFKLWTYLTLSKIGTNTFKPGSSRHLNLPIRSTIQASCCGTNIRIVFIGVLCLHRTGALCGIAALNCSCPSTDIACEGCSGYINHHANRQLVLTASATYIYILVLFHFKMTDFHDEV
jgi:hypothetical protein